MRKLILIIVAGVSLGIWLAPEKDPKTSPENELDDNWTHEAPASPKVQERSSEELRAINKAGLILDSWEDRLQVQASLVDKAGATTRKVDQTGSGNYWHFVSYPVWDPATKKDRTAVVILDEELDLVRIQYNGRDWL